MIQQNALLYGGTGGIGSAICRELREHGYNCWILGRSPESVNRLRRQLDLPSRNTFCTPSITSPQGHAQTRQWLQESDIRLSVAAHCAGYGLFKQAADISLSEWQSLMDINLNSAFSFFKLAWEFRLIGQLDLVYLGSASTDQEWPRNSLYGASKAGLELFCKSLQREVRVEGSRVWLYKPGSVDTPFFDQLPNHLPREKMIKSGALARLVVENLKIDRQIYSPGVVIRSD